MKEIQYAKLNLNAYHHLDRAHYALCGVRMIKLREGLEEIYRSGESSPYGVQPFEGSTISLYIRKNERVVNYDFYVEEKVLIVSKLEPGKGLEGLGESRRVPLNSPAVQLVRKAREYTLKRNGNACVRFVWDGLDTYCRTPYNVQT